jgi:hypothetical protein
MTKHDWSAVAVMAANMKEKDIPGHQFLIVIGIWPGLGKNSRVPAAVASVVARAVQQCSNAAMHQCTGLDSTGLN